MFHKQADALAERVVCSSFKNQEDAQAHYTVALDRDHDGKACNGHHYRTP